MAFLLMGRRSHSFDLSSIGMPGCTLRSSLENLWSTATDRNGRGSFVLAPPNSAALLGLVFLNQLFVFDAAANPLGLLGTRRGRGRVGGA
ncbi:MAG: hypothetical protein ACE5F1_12065 [Planctomycetota bacterium]